MLSASASLFLYIWIMDAVVPGRVYGALAHSPEE
jgi:hypothetical protein